MSHRYWMFDEAFHTSQAFGKRENLGPGNHLPSVLLRSVCENKGDHPAGRGHLSSCNLMTRMLFETRVVDLANARIIE